ncbi:MAG: ABC transporter permease [bacterium]|nr:ABC transporter permease [bacterium]
MFWEILRFELRYQLKRPLLWLVAFFFALMTWGAISSDSVQIGGAIGNVHRNAPFVIVQMIGFMSSIGIFITTMFVAGAILRDFDNNTHELFFSRPVSKRDYLLGRFAGAFLVSCVAFLGAPLGILVGSLMPWLEPERLGPFMFSPYLWGLVVLGLPTLLFSACVFFSLASLSRSMLHTYMGVVGFFALYFLSGVMLQDLDNQYLAAMADPFGVGALQHATKYWTIVERNTMLPPLGGVILYNRLLWVAVGLAALALTLARFRAAAVQRGRKRGLWPWRRRRSQTADAPATPSGLPAVASEHCRAGGAPRFTVGTALRQFLYQTRVEVMGVLKGVPFRIILAFGVFNLVASSGFLDQIFGTPIWPVTHVMLRAIQGTFAFLLIIIVTFYSGELIWRERSVKLSEIYDAMPAPNWVYLGAKLMGQVVVVVAFLVVGVLAAMGVQAYRGYFHFELGVYAQGFVVIILPFLLICFLASFLQVAAGNKFLGYLLMILWVITTLIVFPAMDYQHNLYAFASAPNAAYSDMNGYGHFVEPMSWFFLYWFFGAAILTVLATLLWVRGTDAAWRQRVAIARERFRGPVRTALATAVVGFVATGAWIFYNTNVLNEYVPGDKGEARQADYEKKFRQYKDVPLPRVTDVQVAVDIFPRERRVEARGRYLLVNRNAEPLHDLHVTIPPRVTVNALELPPHSETLDDEEHGYAIYRLEQPLQPGEEMELRFNLAVENPGFRNNGSDTSIVYNGTFFNNRQYFPSFGYNEGAQLVDRNLRRKYDLPVVHRMAKVDDLFARRNTYIASDSDWIDFETTVSTSADQIAIAPGYLQKEWTEGDRRYFHYKMDAPILHFYSYLSADYQVKRDQWNDVAIEIYYHPGHDYNLDRMIDSIKKSLDYFEANFSPYQHRQMRILEFPRYARFAQSFPNTVPFSESIGFIARLDEDDEDALDYPFYVTSHEVAHQWWAHQVIGGNVQGSTLMSETMSQYSALMVMEKEYGPEKMRRFLKHELDNYLRSRSGELVEEMPLLLVENQGYIHYRKGSLVMYALRDTIGEEALNRALAAYTEAVAFQQPPYTNSLELFDFLKRECSPEQGTLLADLFENITLFENRVEEASYAERADGKYAVTVVAKARKVRADGQGVETEIPIDDWIDVGVFGERRKNGESEETVLFLEKRRITEANVTFELVVEDKPVRAGIDPYNKLVDRNSDDNVKKVSETTLAELGSENAGG